MNIQLKTESASSSASRSLIGKVSLVTGSTSGIGLGIARALAEAGSAVVLNGFGLAAETAKTKNQIAADFGVKVSYSAADMTKPEAIADMIATALAEHGRLDVLVNNAGIQHVAPLDRFPIEKWDAILSINLSSAFHSMRLALPAMRKNKFGRIINIASAHGLVASPFKAAYVAAKHGIVGPTKVAALETAEEASPATRSARAMSTPRWSKRRSTARPRRLEFPASRSSVMSCWRSNPTSALRPSRNSARSRYFSPATRLPRSLE